MTSKEKIDIARQLAKLSIDIIEARFPSTSIDDFEAVKMITTEVGNTIDEKDYVPVICGLYRCNENGRIGNFYIKFLEVIKIGDTTLNIPDTVGITMPSEFGKLIADIKANTPGVENVIISTHCQNDLGLSTANTIDLGLVTTNARVNIVMSHKVLVKKLQKELSRMENELKSLNTTVLKERKLQIKQ
ncbi:hypothetical protein RYX36_008998, partial [Vicia faba]